MKQKNVYHYEGVYSWYKGIGKRKIFTRSVWFSTSEVRKSWHQKKNAADEMAIDI